MDSSHQPLIVADVAAAGSLIARSKTFDHATSCSSENSVVVVDAVADALLAAFAREGGVLLDVEEAVHLQAAMFPDGRLSPAVTAQPAARIAALAGLVRPAAADARFLIVPLAGVGPKHPMSGEKLSPVLAFYREPDYDAAVARAASILAYQGAGHSVGLHTREPARATALGLALPVCRVIVNQAHCFATGGSYDNALPFSLSMGCGSWGRNSFADNLNVRHFMNITRVVRPLAPGDVLEPTEEALFGDYRRRRGA